MILAVVVTYNPDIERLKKILIQLLIKLIKYY